MTVFEGGSVEQERNSVPVRKKSRLSFTIIDNQVPDEKSVDVKGAMLNGYVAGDHHKNFSDNPTSNGLLIPPIATLCNLGNTCFLNSVLYTLRFSPSFLHNLHHMAVDLAARGQFVKAKSSSLGRNPSGRSWSSKDLMSLSADGTKSSMQIVTERLHELYEALHASDIKENSEPYQPDEFLHALREVNPIFEGNQQQDAHELLVCLLDNIREMGRFLSSQEPIDLPPEVSELPRHSWGVRKSWKKRKGELKQLHSNRGAESSSKDHLFANGIEYSRSPQASCPYSNNVKAESTDKKYNFVSDDFEGTMILRTTCLECEQITERKETFSDICVPIKTNEESDTVEPPKHVNQLYQSAIITNENLRDLNKYWCEQCLRYNEARRSIQYETLPRILILQLKRFSSTYGSMVSVSKVNDYMPTPFSLACFCDKCCQLKEEERIHQYQLYAVIMHLGATIASGHYVAYVCDIESANDYIGCTRERRNKAASLGKGAGMNTSLPHENKSTSFLKFFFPKAVPDSSSKQINLHSNRNHCRSIDCCGLHLRGEADSISGLPSEPLWFECDDDTIHVLSRKEFEDVLAPKSSKSSALTPYLLFYSRVSNI